MMHNESPDLFDAKERYYQADLEMRRTLKELGRTIFSLESRIVELTVSLIELDKAKGDKP